VRSTCRPRERSTRSTISVVGPGVAPPGYSRDLLVDVGLGLGGSVAGYGVEVGREGDLGFVNVFVVGFECGRVDLGEYELVSR
jgi:hypothetical protein